ncbi:MAG TPA: hypothetical protein VHV10_10550, partial [Ktedonobacteraceae bacterium]|nr:hypothetical protein [Ktedonobacteraceae bacterium]
RIEFTIKILRSHFSEATVQHALQALGNIEDWVLCRHFSEAMLQCAPQTLLDDMRQAAATEWAKSNRTEGGCETKVLCDRFSEDLVELAKKTIGDSKEFEILNELTDATIALDKQRVRALLDEYSPTRHSEIESILNALRSHFSDTLVELAKRLGRIQNIEVLEKIEEAALVSDLQHVWTLVKANDPTE